MFAIEDEAHAEAQGDSLREGCIPTPAQVISSRVIAGHRTADETR
jgi:hypothetical protein